MPTPKILIVSTVPVKNLMELYTDANGMTRTGGLEGQFLAIVVEALGMDYRIAIPEDREFGNLKQDGNFSGIFGMLQRNKADIGCNLLRISEQRFLAADFSTPYAIDGMTFVSERPGNIAPIFGFLYPFDVVIWIGICLSVVALSGFSRALGGGWCFWPLLSSVLKQPLEMGDGSLKWRLVVGCWLQFTLVVGSCYASALLSFLTVPLSGVSIQNFNQLSQVVQFGTHRGYALKGSYQTTWLKKSEDQHNKILGELIERNHWYYKASDIGNNDRYIDATSVMIQGKVLATLSFGLRQDKFLIAKDLILVNPIAMALSKNFCCKKRLNRIISRINCSGIYGKLLRDVSLKLSLKKMKDGYQDDAIKSLSMKDVLGCFVILVIGWVWSSVVFILELAYVRFHSKSNQLCRVA